MKYCLSSVNAPAAMGVAMEVPSMSTLPHVSPAATSASVRVSAE